MYTSFSFQENAWGCFDNLVVAQKQRENVSFEKPCSYMVRKCIERIMCYICCCNRCLFCTPLFQLNRKSGFSLSTSLSSPLYLSPSLSLLSLPLSFFLSPSSPPLSLPDRSELIPSWGSQSMLVRLESKLEDMLTLSGL